MNRCKYIRERIDEAEKPDVLPFEAAEHIGQCNDCEAFASQRAALRKLVAGGGRVNAPINFDAMLNARLAEVKARRSFWRLGSPAFLRLAGATAGLAVMIFAAQYAGLLSRQDQRAGEPAPPGVVSKLTPADELAPRAPQSEKPQVSERESRALQIRELEDRSGARAIRASRRDSSAGRRIVTDGYLTSEDGGVVLVRGRNGDMDVQMPTVSVGAQPLLYVSAGQRPMRNVGASF